MAEFFFLYTLAYAYIYAHLEQKISINEAQWMDLTKTLCTWFYFSVLIASHIRMIFISAAPTVYL